MGGKGLGGGEIKLSCRNLWKVYGDSPNKFFTKKMNKGLQQGMHMSGN